MSAKEAIRRIQAHGVRDDSVKKVSIKSVIEYGSVNAPVDIAAIDCGMKANILRNRFYLQEIRRYNGFSVRYKSGRRIKG